MPPEKIEAVFERGYSSKGMRRGYGLANVKDSVRELGGWIELANQKLAGRYSLYLYRRRNKGGIHLIHIAIAEDDFRVAQIHERLIKQLDGFKIIGKAANAKETLALLKEHKADLLLLDIYMPDELGTALIPDIRSRFPEVDIMIITAATETRHLQEALRAELPTI